MFRLTLFVLWLALFHCAAAATAQVLFEPTFVGSTTSHDFDNCSQPSVKIDEVVVGRGTALINCCTYYDEQVNGGFCQMIDEDLPWTGIIEFDLASVTLPASMTENNFNAYINILVGTGEEDNQSAEGEMEVTVHAMSDADEDGELRNSDYTADSSQIGDILLYPMSGTASYEYIDVTEAIREDLFGPDNNLIAGFTLRAQNYILNDGTPVDEWRRQMVRIDSDQIRLVLKMDETIDFDTEEETTGDTATNSDGETDADTDGDTDTDGDADSDDKAPGDAEGDDDTDLNSDANPLGAAPDTSGKSSGCSFVGVPNGSGILMTLLRIL